ncbi:MAG: glucosamine-6-phosphate deaminase [Verrucomicrobia bacterium]|nr:glucosamine-6-phosphate deaminase [Verrucomicrobiota bacterium]
MTEFENPFAVNQVTFFRVVLGQIGFLRQGMNILRFDNETGWVEGVATFWRDRLRLNPRLRICLPSGHTPNPIFAAMVRAVQQKQVSFQQAAVFTLDEFGGLAPEDPGRCKNALLEHLMNRIDLPKAQFYALNPDAPDLEKECRAFESAIGGPLDLVLLGLGLNGHLGMNEPGSSVNSGTRRTDLHESTIQASAKYVSHQQLPRWGLTIGLKQILEAKEVWLIANGAKKAEIIRRTVTGPIDESVPGSLLRKHVNCSLFMDAAAASRL